MSFDEIFDLTAGVYFHFLKYINRCVMSPRITHNFINPKTLSYEPTLAALREIQDGVAGSIRAFYKAG